MNINERIKELGGYFKGLNIVQDSTFILVKFPEKWKVFDETFLNENFNVYTGSKDGMDGIFFLTETANGVDCLFDAVNHVIAENKAFEEKAALLQEKANELRDLFINEPLEKLRTLEFTFNVKKPARKPKNGLKKGTPEVIEEQAAQEPVKNEEPVIEESAKAEKKVTKKPAESDTMSFMKELTEGGKKK